MAGTLVAVTISYTATGLALAWTGHGFVPVAVLLSIGLPLTLGPATMYPLIAMNHRQRLMRSELEQLVGTDMLTGLPNRRAFFQRAGEMLLAADSTVVPMTAIMIDVDHFKPINDTYGHDAGDAVLRRIARRIRDSVADSGARQWMVARLGGEEFVALVEGLVPTAVARLADRICAEARAAEHDEINAAPATVSLGIAFHRRGMGVDRLLKLADDAVYAAKDAGRDRWAFSGTPRQVRRPLRSLPEAANDRIAVG